MVSIQQSFSALTVTYCKMKLLLLELTATVFYDLALNFWCSGLSSLSAAIMDICYCIQLVFFVVILCFWGWNAGLLACQANVLLLRNMESNPLATSVIITFRSVIITFTCFNSSMPCLLKFSISCIIQEGLHWDKVKWPKIEWRKMIKEQRCYFFFFWPIANCLNVNSFLCVLCGYGWRDGTRACVLGKHSTIDFYH